MTDLKKGKHAARVGGLQRVRGGAGPAGRKFGSCTHLRSAASDPFDDVELDAALEKALGEGVEPRLLLLDRLLNGTRVRREV